MIQSIFFDTWLEIFRVIVSAVIIYIFLILMLRLSGKRTLSKWNAFDFVVTIALGSILASIILNKDVTIAEGIISIGFLILLQSMITWISVRAGWFENVVKARPTLLYSKDSFLTEKMQSQRVTRSEMLSAVRTSGIGALEQVEAVVLETDGSFSVIKKSQEGYSDNVLQDVDGYEAHRNKFDKKD